MMVGGEGLADAQFMHQYEADAIGERPFELSSMISRAAIDDAVDISVFGFALGVVRARRAILRKGSSAGARGAKVVGGSRRAAGFPR